MFCFNFQKAVSELGKTKTLSDFIKRQERQEDLSDAVMESELRFLWNIAFTSRSFHSEDHSVQLFQVMFPECKRASKMSCGRTKQTYLLNFALAPYCTQAMVNEIGNGPYSIAYDECDGLMMIVIRYVYNRKIHTQILDLRSLDGDLTASNCTDSIVKSVDEAGLARRKCISDFSDSCNTMRGRCSPFYSK